MVSQLTFSQEKWSTQTGSLSFEASVPFFEEIKANNTNVNCTLDSRKGSIQSWVYIRDFQFKKDLMRTHFNEIYMESDKYSRAIFKGKILNIDLNTIDSKVRKIVIKGKINIHGKSKDIVVGGVLRKSMNRIFIQSDFVLHTDDFKIKISSMILPKISKEVRIHLDVSLDSDLDLE